MKHTMPLQTRSCAGRGVTPRLRSRTLRPLCCSKSVLYDVPVSNHGARVRYIVYKKKLEDEIDIKSPQAIGGLKSDAYLALNPQGKMPLLVLPDGTAIAESEVISQYLLDAYKEHGPAMAAATPQLRAVSALVSRIHDIYITPIQGCMYRQMEPEERHALLGQLQSQLGALEALLEGPYAAGATPTGGDATLLGTFVFLTYILPRYFGWGDVFAGRPKLAAWWGLMQQDEEASRVIGEVRGALEQWSASGRWDKVGITAQVADGRFDWALGSAAPSST